MHERQMRAGRDGGHSGLEDSDRRALMSLIFAATGLTIGARYWLGTAGGVTATPLDETSAANANKISQYLGVAKSATELVTDDDGYVVL